MQLVTSQINLLQNIIGLKTVNPIESIDKIIGSINPEQPLALLNAPERHNPIISQINDLQLP
jgi:hypothetical protein